MGFQHKTIMQEPAGCLENPEPGWIQLNLRITWRYMNLEMKNDYLMGYHDGKTAWTLRGLGLALLLTLLLLLAACGGGTATNSSQTPTASASTPTTKAATSVATPTILTLSQAQQQAGYHLLSIPSSLTGYTFTRVLVTKLSGHQVYVLYYTMGKDTVTIIQGQPLGNQAGNAKVSLRGTTATLITNNGLTTLFWTENGVGRTIAGRISSTQAIALAKSLI